jgi:aminopeptidase N/puromycin-sensitive aminopeptidase
MQEFALGLLSYFRNPELERRALEYAVSGKVRNQDAIFQLMRPLEQAQTRQVAWSFIQNNWGAVQKQLTKWMGAYLVGSTGAFCSEDMKAQMVSFFQTHPVPASSRSLQRAKNEIDDCVQLRSAQGPKLTSWVAAQ